MHGGNVPLGMSLAIGPVCDGFVYETAKTGLSIQCSLQKMQKYFIHKHVCVRIYAYVHVRIHKSQKHTQRYV
jgi:hypothetical protein